MAKDKKTTEKVVSSTEKKTANKPSIKIKFTKPNLGKFKGLVKPALTVLGVFLAFVFVDLLVQYLNNDYSVAVVNGVRITKSDYHEKLEKWYGKSTAKLLIDQEILKQEAVKAEVEASDEEITKTLNDIIASTGGQESYEAALTANDLTEEELKLQIEEDILTKKLLEPIIEYTEDDIKVFFDQYSAVIFPNETAALEEGEKLDYEEFKEETKDYFIQNEIQNDQVYNTWISEKYDEYKIQDNTLEKPKYGVLTTTINIFKNLFEEMNSNKEE